MPPKVELTAIEWGTPHAVWEQGTDYDYAELHASGWVYVQRKDGTILWIPPHRLHQCDARL